MLWRPRIEYDCLGQKSDADTFIHALHDIPESFKLSNIHVRNIAYYAKLCRNTVFAYADDVEGNKGRGVFRVIVEPLEDQGISLYEFKCHGLEKQEIEITVVDYISAIIKAEHFDAPEEFTKYAKGIFKSFENKFSEEDRKKLEADFG